MTSRGPRALPLLALLIAGAFFSTEKCLAFDVGDPSFRPDAESPRHQVEFLFDSIDRRVRNVYDRVVTGTAAGGPMGAFPAPPEDASSIDGNAMLVRTTWFPTELLSTQFDVGYNDQSSGGDTTLVLGGAARLLLLERGPFQLASQFSAHFVPDVDTKDSGVNPTLGRYVAQGEVGFNEYGLALLGSLELPTNDEWLATIYGGPRFSRVRGRATAVVDYENTIFAGTMPVGNRAWFSSVQKEETVFGAVLGLRIDCSDKWSARVETRLIEETSLSFGIGTRF